MMQPLDVANVIAFLASDAAAGDPWRRSIESTTGRAPASKGCPETIQHPPERLRLHLWPTTRTTLHSPGRACETRWVKCMTGLTNWSQRATRWKQLVRVIVEIGSDLDLDVTCSESSLGRWNSLVPGTEPWAYAGRTAPWLLTFAGNRRRHARSLGELPVGGGLRIGDLTTHPMPPRCMHTTHPCGRSSPYDHGASR